MKFRRILSDSVLSDHPACIADPHELLSLIEAMKTDFSASQQMRCFSLDVSTSLRDVAVLLPRTDFPVAPKSASEA